jgi:RNA-directed DNA polymerase
MSSGSYFPPPVKAVPIPKKSGDGERILGVPTVGDRIAQTAVTLVLEPLLEPVFHEDSYGYRPGKSAHDALAVTRQRCWKRDWVLEYDIRGLFDNIDHELLLKALRHHCKERWVLLLVERWLVVPMQGVGGTKASRTVGTPQGGPLSPLLSNLFLHYALDHWLATRYSSIPFCRYADDGILHCTSEEEANLMRKHLDARLREVGLELHPEKTRVVYCKDSNRTGQAENVQFDFLGYSFKPRKAINRSGKLFTSFAPGISPSAATSIRQTVRGWRLGIKSYASIEDLARCFSPAIRGWIGYYGRFYRSALEMIAFHLDAALVRWAMRKYKRFKRQKTRAFRWLAAIRRTKPGLFPHWALFVA